MFFFFKQNTAYEMRISDWSSDVCSSDLLRKHSVGADQMNPILADLGSSPITQKTRSFNILARPHVHMQHVAQADPKLAELLAHRESEIIEQAEIQVKYESYFDKEIEIVNKKIGRAHV